MSTIPLSHSQYRIDESREENVFLAKVAERTERFKEMVEHMKNVAKLDIELTLEERNLLSIAYKNIVAPIRASLRILASMEQDSLPLKRKNKLEEYNKRIQNELHDVCIDVIDLLDKHLIPASQSSESKVFFYKMKGDYLRYQAECTKEEQKKFANEALSAYQKALDIAVTELPSVDPIRLGLALNFAIFYYEILRSPSRACDLAKHAFDCAIAEIDTLTDDAYKDSTIILQLLRELLTKWTSEYDDDLKPTDQGEELQDVKII